MPRNGTSVCNLLACEQALRGTGVGGTNPTAEREPARRLVIFVM